MTRTEKTVVGATLALLAAVALFNRGPVTVNVNYPAAPTAPAAAPVATTTTTPEPTTQLERLRRRDPNPGGDLVLDGGPARSAPTPAAAPTPGGRININTASVEELDRLPGIGPSKAMAITAARPYNSVDDLIRAHGIGSVTLEKLRSLVTTGNQP